MHKSFNITMHVNIVHYIYTFILLCYTTTQLHTALFISILTHNTHKHLHNTHKRLHNTQKQLHIHTSFYAALYRSQINSKLSNVSITELWTLTTLTGLQLQILLTIYHYYFLRLTPSFDYYNIKPQYR